MDGSMRRRILLSYDIDANSGSVRAKVSRMIFGSKVSRTYNGGTRTYRYGGILDHPDVRYVGQSVLLLPPSMAEWLAARLRALGVVFKQIVVYLES
jgi:hypothetical protein